MTYESKIKKAKVAKAKAEAKLKRHQDKILELKQIVYKLNDELYDLDLDISSYKEENFYKKQCQLLEKQYDFLHIDEIHEDVIWFSCDLYDEHNEEADPYYDAHFVDCWRALHNAFSEYINIAIDKKVVS